MMKLSKEAALERLRNTCSRSEKCLFDIKKKLVEWGLSDDFDSISQILIEEGFINEERYATSFVNDKIKFSKWGKQKVRYQLQMRGIETQLITTTIENYPQDEYIMMVKKELEKKNNSIKESNKYKKLQKLYAFAAQRGFEIDIARELFGDLDQ